MNLLEALLVEFVMILGIFFLAWAIITLASRMAARRPNPVSIECDACGDEVRVGIPHLCPVGGNVVRVRSRDTR
jgi:hypothetical protein